MEKSTTCKRFAKSIIELNADNSVALNGELPRMIDEWQTVSNLWNKVKSRVDSLGVFGQYILTGSATPADNSKIHHSGSGRITSIIMRPMSLFKSKDSIGKYSIKEIFDEKYSKPSFAMILTATGKAYRRNDGIYVIPINLLRN